MKGSKFFVAIPEEGLSAVLQTGRCENLSVESNREAVVLFSIDNSLESLNHIALPGLRIYRNRLDPFFEFVDGSLGVEAVIDPSR